MNCFLRGSSGAWLMAKRVISEWLPVWGGIVFGKWTPVNCDSDVDVGWVRCPNSHGRSLERTEWTSPPWWWWVCPWAWSASGCMWNKGKTVSQKVTQGRKSTYIKLCRPKNLEGWSIDPRLGYKFTGSSSSSPSYRFQSGRLGRLHNVTRGLSQ